MSFCDPVSILATFPIVRTSIQVAEKNYNKKLNLDLLSGNSNDYILITDYILI